MRQSCLAAGGALLACLLSATASGQTTESDAVDFNRDIRPVLSDVCFACHGPDDATREADMRLDLKEAVFAAREKALIVPGRPEESELYRRLMSTDDAERMPPPESKKQLTGQQKENVRRWIEQGAPWDTHWAWIPPARHAVPDVEHPGFTRNAIDRFVLDRLRREKLEPSPVADDVTLVRRLHFDLTGLPPTPAEVDAWLASTDPQKYEHLVETLLASPHFGERMAVYWLDVVRYADSNGYHSDEARQVAPYRDWVIESFNQNRPYDRFVVEQLAGDLLPDPTQEMRVASGFNMLLQTTNEGGAQEKEYLARYIADRVRNTSQIFLGTTMGCCECHNHKFDPFTIRDFYSFGAFFADIQERGRGNPPTYPVMTETARVELDAITGQLADLRNVLSTQTEELTVAQRQWEAEVKPKLDTAAEFGPWHSLGPFPAASFDEAHTKAFGPEEGLADGAVVDLAKKFGRLKWEPREAFVDGQLHNLTGDNSATYLIRSVKVGETTRLEVMLGSDDGVTVWVNGVKVHDNKVQRAAEAGQDHVSVELKPDDNQLLMKISNGGGGYSFHFQAASIAIPPSVVAVLKLADGERSEGQAQELAAFYRTIAPLLDPVRQQVAALVQRNREINDALPRTLMTQAGAPRAIRVLQRGNWMDESGAEVEPSIPGFLGSLDVGERRASRLDLADWIVRRENPLTARTFANRMWKLYFGQGLATPLDDLGGQGMPPTHPRLLDWLSVEFMESGWDVKHMVRLLVNSGTYRQSSLAAPELRKRDPYNRFYARQSRFRLDAEFVRDNALAVSGLLVDDVGGRSVYPYQPAGYWRHMNFPAREWPGDAGSNLYRRGLYTWWQRMFLHPSLLAFDAPSREECTVERPRSNIPQQALVLLNDPTYVEASRAFGARILLEGGSTTEDRLNWAFRAALSRPASADELSVLRPLVAKHLEEFRADAAAAQAFTGVGAAPMTDGTDPAELAAWASIARVILNLHETLTRS